MATAHAYRWSRYGIKVFIGSRDPAKGKRLAAKIGGCQGGGHVEMIGASNFLILCIPPGPPSLAFIDQHREELVGKGKMFVDLSASFTRSAAACSEPTWLHGTVSAPRKLTTSPRSQVLLRRATAPAAVLLAPPVAARAAERPDGLVGQGLGQPHVGLHQEQPLPAGRGGGRRGGQGESTRRGAPCVPPHGASPAPPHPPQAVATRLLTTAGFEPLDCGDAEDTPKIEPGYHERRWKHPRHLEFNGEKHP